MFLQLGSIPTLIISSAGIARQVFKTHDLIFSNRPILYAASKLSYGCSDVSFAPYGEYWRQVRKIVILELLSLKRVQSFEAVRDEELKIMLHSIAQSSSSSVSFNLSQAALLLTNNIICRVVFGRKFDGGEENKGASKFQEMLEETEDLLAGFNVADFFPWMKWVSKFNGFEAKVDKNFRQMDELFDQVIEEHLDPQRPEREDKDLVDILLRFQKDQNQAFTLTNRHIKAVLLDMFVAGTDTSAATLIWIMAELMKNPSVMRRAQDEVRRVAKSKGKVEEEDLFQLGYLKLVVKEGLRLHPVLPLLLPRETMEDCVISGYEIPAKTRVFVNALSIGSDPECWENPTQFQPERFLDSSIDFKGQNYELLPFGVGRRGCPGINFAILLIELVLANLLYCFDWKLPEGMRREDLDMEEAFGLAMHKKTSLCLIATSYK